MARVKQFKAGLGLSIEINGVWHKFNCEVDVEPDENDDMEQVKSRAWDTVSDQIYKQIDEIKNS